MNALAGTKTLTLLALRRDRFMLPAWILTFVAVNGFSALASKDLYGTPLELETAARGWNASTALIAMHGRIYDVTSLGAGSLVKMTGLGTAFIALLASLLVIRHTRADEEVGRYELAAAGEVGRYAAVTAALIVSIGTIFGICLLSAPALMVSGLPVAGSIAFSLAWLGAGTVFALVGAVAAQLATTARASRGVASTALATFYVIRAVGDTAPDDGARWASWLSPFGWAQQVRPYAGDRWWALGPALLFSLALLGATVLLLRHRDLGAGILADRPGPPTGPRLVSPLALAWRQHRLALLGWSIGFGIVGFMLGGIASTIQDMFDNPQFMKYLEILGGVSRLEDAFLSAELGIVAIVASGFGISTAARMRSEEAQGRAEALLSTGISRASYAASHLVVGLLGTLVLLTTVGLAVGTSHAIAVDDPDQVLRVLGAALARLPATWVMTTLVMALFGVSGRLTVWAWVALVGVVVIGEFGPLMNFPGWTLDFSPFAHVPNLPGSDMAWPPLAWLTLTAAVLAGAGLTAFRHRDLQPD